ncbi:MAG: inositol 2-dehydrogenase [Sneathiella sp.]|nr:inositol 2-dehydrogenase [Sneathiella sp.]
MIGICQFGAGRIGQIHAANAAASGRAELKYVVDVNADAAAELAGKYQASTASIEEALRDPDIKAVIIASSTDTHADLIEASARAGKAIFCEKPIDLSLARVEQAIEVIEDTGVTTLIGFNRRFDPTMGSVCRAARSGAVGDLETVIITSRDPSPPPVSYVKVSGGLFRDMMIHDLDLAHWILGEVPVEVYAKGSCLIDPNIGAAGDIDTAAVTLTSASGVLVHITNNRRAAYGYDQRLEVFGSKGMVKADNRSSTAVTTITEHGVISDKPLHFFLERYEDAYKAEMAHFLDCIEGKAKPMATMQDGRVALILADAAQQSVETGLPVKISQ